MAGKSKTKKLSKKDRYHYFEIDLWVTNLNTTEIGIYQQSRYRAKSRQFTKDMDIYGAIKENGEKVGFIGYRKELWKNNEGMAKRLVIKQFTDEMNWRATMDLMLGRSVQLTHGAGGFPVTAFSVNVAGHDQLVQIERSAYKWLGAPESFSFFLLIDGRPRFYRLKQDWINIGDDFTLYDEHRKKVGHLNGKVLNFGGKWKCWVDKEHASKELNTVLQIFCGMLKFNIDCRYHIQDLVDDMHDGKIIPKLGSQETDLYMNPRRMR